MYDPHKSEITFDVAEGRFFKIDGGYVLLAVINSMTDVKPESNIPGTAISFEIFNREYERYVNSENPSAKTTPSKMQIELCSFLDKVQNEPEEFLFIDEGVLKGNFKGSFQYSSSSVVLDLIQGKNDLLYRYLFKEVQSVKPDKISESLSKATEGKRVGSFSSQSEQQRLEHRLNLVYKAFAPYAPNPDEFKLEFSSIISVMVGLAASEDDFEKLIYKEVRWLLELLLRSS